MGIKNFENLAIDENVAFLNQTLLNIFRNYISSKKIKSGHWQLSWMTNKTRDLLKKRSKLTKQFYKNGKKEVKNLPNALERFLKLKNSVLKMT